MGILHFLTVKTKKSELPRKEVRLGMVSSVRIDVLEQQQIYGLFRFSVVAEFPAVFCWSHTRNGGKLAVECAGTGNPYTLTYFGKRQIALFNY